MSFSIYLWHSGSAEFSTLLNDITKLKKFQGGSALKQAANLRFDIFERDKACLEIFKILMSFSIGEGPKACQAKRENKSGRRTRPAASWAADPPPIWLA
jgi:hypothetical protein